MIWFLECTCLLIIFNGYPVVILNVRLSQRLSYSASARSKKVKNQGKYEKQLVSWQHVLRKLCFSCFIFSLGSVIMLYSYTGGSSGNKTVVTCSSFRLSFEINPALPSVKLGCDRSKNVYHPLNQSDAKAELIVTWSLAFSRAYFEF